VAGRHRRTPHYRATHRKAPSAAQRVVPAGAAAAVIAAGVVIGAQSFDTGSAHGLVAAPGGLASPAPPLASVLAFHSNRPAPHQDAHHAPQHRHDAHHKAARHHDVKPAALRLVDTGSPCYIRVTNRHGKVVVERILHARQHLRFQHRGLRIVLGNAGGVRISVAGRHFHRAGAAGQVRRFGVR
jgi:hypothetical protein